MTELAVLRCVRALAMTVAALWHPLPALAQLPVVQVIENPVANTFAFGGALDSDGDTLVVGAPAPSENGNGIQRGAVSVYTRVGGTWVLQQSLTRSTGLGFGSSVAVSGDTLIASSSYISPFVDPGPLVYVRRNGIWAQQAELRPSNTSVRTGARVLLDGDTALVQTVDRGVYVFVSTGDTWTQQQQLLLESSSSSRTVSIALSGDTALVGVSDETVGGDLARGAVHVYTRAAGVWAEQATLTVPLSRASETIGWNIAFSGNTALILGDEVYQFVRTGGTWQQQPSLRLPLASILSNYPTDVALGGDTAIVRMTIDPRAPSETYVYRRIAERWIRLDPAISGGRYRIEGDTIFEGTSAGDYRGRVLVHPIPPVSFTGPPGRPDFVRAAVSGNTITMTWEPPQTGGAPTDYTLIGRATAGGPVLATVPMGLTSSFTVNGPNGRFFLTITASNADGTGPESSAVSVNLPAPISPIGAPTNLRAIVTGATVSLTWDPPTTGGAPTGYTVWAGLTPSVSPPLVTLPVGTARSYTATGVAAGTYYVFVQARNSFSFSAASNVVTVSVGAQPLPGVPTLQTPVVSGSTVSLSWSPGSGGTPTSYTLAASASPDGPHLVTVPLSGTSASFTNVPSGTYYLRLTATNSAGTSAPSPIVTVVVP